MITKLRPFLLFISVLFASSIQAKDASHKEISGIFDHHIMILDISEHLENHHDCSFDVFSYNCKKFNHLELDDVNDKHPVHISFIDIISSDEGSDFNCSGGFCMDKSHSHKKGLSIKRQLFGYFIKISC